MRDASDVLTVSEVNGVAGKCRRLGGRGLRLGVIGTDGAYSFTPNGAANALAAGETATDTFTYTVSDGNGGTDTATVTITITGPNEARWPMPTLHRRPRTRPPPATCSPMTRTPTPPTFCRSPA